MNTFIKGMDLSTLPEVERCGGKFYDNGKPGDAVSILKSYGMNLVRLRLWNDPYSEDGVPYGAGTGSIGCWISTTAISGQTPASRPFPKAGGEWSRRRWPEPSMILHFP